MKQGAMSVISAGLHLSDGSMCGICPLLIGSDFARDPAHDCGCHVPELRAVLLGSLRKCTLGGEGVEHCIPSLITVDGVPKENRNDAVHTYLRAQHLIEGKMKDEGRRQKLMAIEAVQKFVDDKTSVR